MRIGIDCRSLQEPQPSGVSLYTRELLRAMFAVPESSQHEFVLFVNASSIDSLPHMKNLQQEFSGENIEWRIKKLPNKLVTTAEILTRRWPSARWMFGDVDVAFVPNMQFYPINDESIPYVVTVHDLSFERYPECLDIKGRLRHMLLWPRSFVENAAQVITVSEHTKTDVEELYNSASDNITAIYPGIPEQPIPAGVKSVPARYFLSVATIEPRKNIDTLLDAFVRVREEYSDIELIVAGGAGWKSSQSIQRMKKQEGVQYIGYITAEQKQHLYENALGFVYPSVYEGFGFPPVEAQRAGTPVLVGQHSSLPEVLGDSAVYIDVLDSDSMYRGMSAVASDQEFRHAMVTKGEKNVQRFSWEHAARQVYAVLKNRDDKR